MNTLIDEYIENYQASRYLEDRSTEGVTRDIAFNRRSFGDSSTPSSNGRVQVGVDGIEVELVQGINEDDFARTLRYALAAGGGFDMEKPLEEIDWKEMLEGGIQTALETQVVCFAVKGVSRVCTHQLVRTRKAAFHQQGQRGRYVGNSPEFRMPESIWAKPVARRAMMEALVAAHKAYETAVEEDVAYQDARFILPEGSTNFILCEYPLRTFIDTYAYRACSMFQWEIVQVFREMKRVLVEAHNWMEPYVKISCEQTHGALDEPSEAEFNKMSPQEQSGIAADHEMGAFDHHCTYQGHEKVYPQCEFEWARESNRSFKSKQHEIGAK